MESHIVNAQIQEMKSNFARFISAQSNSEPDSIMFSKPVMFMLNDNPDMVCAVYGINRGIILFDSPHTGIESIDIGTLPIETLVKVKEQMEYHYKNKEYSRI